MAGFATAASTPTPLTCPTPPTHHPARTWRPQVPQLPPHHPPTSPTHLTPFPGRPGRSHLCAHSALSRTRTWPAWGGGSGGGAAAPLRATFTYVAALNGHAELEDQDARQLLCRLVALGACCASFEMWRGGSLWGGASGDRLGFLAGDLRANARLPAASPCALSALPLRSSCPHMYTRTSNPVCSAQINHAPEYEGRW